ncbi:MULTISPECIES: succinyldiaminopimelate transaminase [Bifidobacterium]|uniref:succinyldiaminopimelate transaminase n=1 Tax=Bifidobacterium TaxID=1678 RepID=UPI001BDD86C8|nr:MULTISPECIES: succinyldiaminopimelate transaminase [Bifidobacterium]MBT1160542.1 succinyldiaminopimelate transaminase [Bifidobacterium sp. SO1]MBW3078575.1 succinyldiaminopimelate transaminase [Bifidobacterium simiiventris]
MGFHEFASPYDWSRLATYRRTAKAAFGGMIDLSVGSPIDPVPDSVRQALADASDDPNAYGYPVTVGTPDLQAAIAEWFRDCRGVDLAAVDAAVVPTVGSKEAVALMASLLRLGEGDVVVQPTVSYPTYEIGTQLAGATVLKVDDVTDVDSWKHVPGVRAIWINSPCNPTGKILPASQMAGIVAAAREIGAVVLSDECYALMTWGQPVWNRSDACAAGSSASPSDEKNALGRIAAPCALSPEVCGGSSQGVLSLYSLSKQSNMAGYRTAFIAGDPAIVKPMSIYRKQIGQIIPGPVQAAMAAALRDRESVRIQHDRYLNRLGVLVGALRAYGYAVNMPDGALYAWVKAKSGDCWQDMAALAEIGIIASPGEFYGAPQYLRFSATATDKAIADAAERLAR